MKTALHALGCNRDDLLQGDRWNSQLPLALKSLKADDLKTLMSSYEKLDKAADDYLRRKENEMKQKGRLDEKSKTRVKIAMQIKELIQPQRDHINSLAAAQRQEAQAEKERGNQGPAAQAQTGKEAIKPAASSTGTERLSDLLSTLTEQCEKRKQVRNGMLDKNDPSVLHRKDLASKLFEAFAVVELVYAVGSRDVRLDSKRVNLMCQALRTDKQKNPSAFDNCMQELKKEIPGVDLAKLHQDNYADMRKVISLSINSPLVAERMETLTGLLKAPNSVFGEMQQQGKTFEAENKTMDLRKQNKKPNNNNSKRDL